jgi:hypothetical protein
VRKLFLLLIVICGVTLTGCAQLIDMNDQESDVLAEYMAGTMLRHADNYDEALIYPETTETAETAETTETTDISDPINNTIENTTEETPDITTTLDDSQNGNIVNLENMFKGILKDNFGVTYTDYKFYDSYPDENEFFTLETTKDKKLLAVTFNVKNITNKSKTLDLKEYNLIYQLTDNEDITYNPMMTLLNNDIQYINLKIAAGKTQKAVILFNVPKDIDMTNMKLAITYKDKTTLLELNQ